MERKQTYGEQAVGLSFDPSGNEQVDKLKRLYADVIDCMDSLRNASSGPEVKRLCSIAITEAQAAQMWAVKAVTWRI